MRVGNDTVVYGESLEDLAEVAVKDLFIPIITLKPVIEVDKLHFPENVFQIYLALCDVTKWLHGYGNTPG